VVQHHPHRSGTDLRAKLVRCFARHGSILLENRSLRETRGGSNLCNGRVLPNSPVAQVGEKQVRPDFMAEMPANVHFQMQELAKEREF
jgi:hypothetical protein